MTKNVMKEIVIEIEVDLGMGHNRCRTYGEFLPELS
jgi:hypothetical protein